MSCRDQSRESSLISPISKSLMFVIMTSVEQYQ
uniref:Uncharacterized protein n=1 Tax=Lotus japonicus TaxID=34305 RepID=I3SD59_LOTJA|nr:unknown [Lotus japonicus]